MHSPVKGIHSLIIPTRVRYFGSELHRRHVIIIIKAITETINYLIWTSYSYLNIVRIHAEKTEIIGIPFLCCVRAAAFPCRLRRFVVAGGLRKARPEPKSMVLCWTDTCRARPPAPEVINMHLQPPRPSHCPLPRPHVLAPLSPLGTCYSSSVLRGL